MIKTCIKIRTEYTIFMQIKTETHRDPHLQEGIKREFKKKKKNTKLKGDFEKKIEIAYIYGDTFFHMNF